ncbi:alpha/beta hydrolase [Leucobacter allii]|uniref:alpha/beta hydrolase n=1 Tax=Leucobacter allii TaxID=2932247 RepID=UPI001FD2B456|nr:alpha/beta hydrolase [Leucobacter allii]UOR02750.1 alpha/beta hydrolase [Leucobacter allii]
MTVSRRPRSLRIAAWIGIALGALVLVAIAAFLVWAGVGRMDADPAAVAALEDDPAVTATHADGAWVVAPATEPDGTGLVFLPGAKVDAAAYAPTFRELAAEGTTVVIPDLPLRFAILETRGIDDFTAYAPDVERWAVGGHSLGGVRACQLAADDPDVALLLLASYCAVDLADSGVPVLSISGSADGLSTPEKIDGAAELLPATAEFVELAGANHAAFGWYGAQPGDGDATTSRADVAAEVSRLVHAFLAGS